MVLTLEQMLNAEQVLVKISQANLPTLTAWRLLKTIQQIQKECNTFREFRVNKIKEYGVFDEQLNDYILNKDNPNFNKFIEELTPLLQEKSDINIVKINIEDLKETNLTIQELASIDWLIEE